MFKVFDTLKIIAKKLLPSELRHWIKRIFFGKSSGERVYLHYDLPPPIGTTERAHWILYNLALNYIQGDIVLDAGCGSGFGSYLLSQKFQKVIGFDYSRIAINFARKYNSNDKTIFIQSDVKYFDYPRKFDAIVMIEFLEHNQDPKEVFRKMYSFLNVGGTMIVSFPRCSEGTPLKRGWHLHEFTDSRVKNVFENYDYRICGLKNLAFVDSSDFSKEEDFFVDDIKNATNFFIIVRKDNTVKIS